MVNMKRIISFLLVLASLCSLLPAVSWQAEAAETSLVSTSTAPSTTAAEVDTLFTARSEGQHPRILADADKFAEIRQKIMEDDYSKVLYAKLYEYCLEEIDKPVSEYSLPDGVRLLSISRTASSRIIWMSMVYQISGERRFAQRAVEEMLAVCAFSDWNPSHYLDVAQMAYGVGIGYDWLYHYMTEEQRATVRTALYDYTLMTAYTPSTGKYHWVFASNSNWNPWCMAGIAIAASAIYEYYPTVCSTVMAKTVSSIQGSLALFTPLGAYPEGAGYYRLGTEFSAIYFETMKSILGTDFGLSDLPGVRESSKYLLATTGYVNTFNFGDCSANILDGAMLHWYAGRFNMPELSVHQRQYQSRNSELMDDVLSLIWYDPELVAGYSAENAQLDYLMYSDYYQSVASFRSFNADPYQIYAAIKSGYNSTSHADMDIGSFVLEAMGERWFMDLGSDNYNLPGYGYKDNGYAETIGRWDYYRKRAEGHNTLVINPGDRGGQDAFAKCQIADYKSSYDGGYAIVDMLDAYNNDGDEYTEDVVTAAKRGLMLFHNRSRVLLRDELTCSSASELYWFAHTKAEISISADGKTATLTQNGKTLLAQIAAPADAVFTQMEAVPLSTSPNPSGQGDNTGVRKLVIHLTGVTSTEISVVFTPIQQESDSSKELPENISLENLGQQLHDYDEDTTLPVKQGVYEIHNVEQLCKLSDIVKGGNSLGGKTIRLMADIDMQGRTFQPIGGCIPVGSDPGNLSFNGTFDGNGHTIKNLCIFKPGYEFVGFFGRTYNATIRDLGIESGVVFGSGKASGLIGATAYTTVENCYNKANVISDGQHAGGIVGELGANSMVNNCYNNADIKNYSNVSGGIIGYVTSGSNVTISNCYHVGNLTDSVGHTGLIGYYVTIEGHIYLVGTVTVNNCYATTPIKSAAIPENANREFYTSCAQITEAELPRLATDLSSAFIYDCEWENDGYPVLQWQCGTFLPKDLALSTEAELRLLAYQVNSGAANYSGRTVTLCNDIDLDSREWVPIGGSTTAETDSGRSFNGTFNGNGYGIKNLKVSTSRYFNGFFGNMNGSVLNFGVKSGSVTGVDKVGGIAGRIGGNGTIDNCYNRASVQGRSFVGGIVGMGAKVTIRNCYNTGAITSTNEAAGIVGYFASDASGSSLTNCYNAGKLSGNKKGGLIGALNSALSNFPVNNSYALNDVALVYDAARANSTSSAACTEADLKAKAAALGSAFAPDSAIPQNDGYPILNSSLYGTAAVTLQPDANGVYNISTAQELRSIAYMVNVLGETFSGKTVKLLSDIDLGYVEWIPIGGNDSTDGEEREASAKYFSGNFDGNSHKIYNLAITTGNYYLGLFGHIGNAEIINVGIENGCIFGSKYVGGIVGFSAEGSRIDGCYNKANICGIAAVGGIVGMLGATNTLSNCYNMASVDTGDYRSGGIVGYLTRYAGATSVEYCYNMGTQSAGIVGYCYPGITTAIRNCVTVNTVELVGSESARTSLNVDENTCAQKTAAELLDHPEVPGSAFAKDYLVQNNLYPVLAWENGDAATELTTDANGTYLVRNANELRLLSYLVATQYLEGFKNKNILLTADIDLEGKLFLPIGCQVLGSNKIFRGKFNGGGHTVSNLLTANVTSQYVGLFGAVSTGYIENVGLESGVIIGREHVGLVGNLAGGSRMRRCYNKATIYGRFHVGGLVGMINSDNVWVKDCYNTGAVYALNTITNASGLVGYFASNTNGVTIENCYDVGTYITAIREINLNNGSADNVIKNVYSVGGVMMVYMGATACSSIDASLASPADMKTYHTVLGSEFVEDKHLNNQGYPVLAWERSDEITDRTNLFVDFNDEEIDRLRYADYTYGFTQFDNPAVTNWYNHAGLSSQTVNEGTLTLNAAGEVSAATWPAVATETYDLQVKNLYQLHYDPSGAEYFQIRFKMKNFRQGEQIKDGATNTPTPYLKLAFYADGSTSGTNGTSDYTAHKNYINSGEWLLVTLPVNDAFKNAREIQGLRVYFGGVESISTEEPGEIEIDYIYVGSYEDLPGKRNLYFTFNDTEEDQIRYDSKTYGYVQFDDSEEVHWSYSSKILTGTSIENGELTYHVRGEYDSSVTYAAAYADTYTPGNADPLFYDPAQAEVWQIRFKVEGMAKANSPYVDLHLWGLDDEGNVIANRDSLNMDHMSVPNSAMTSGEYVVLTMDMTEDKFAGCSVITRVRPYFGQIKSADPNNPGTITIDYIYIGTEAELPTPRHKVSFIDGNGNELKWQYVYEGEAAMAPTATPTKAFDGTYHYIFTGWDQAFDNVTGDLTVTAQFTPTIHNYDAGVVTTKPTCTDTGIKTYTCEDCGATKTETLAATGHTPINYAVYKEPTLSETGQLNSYCVKCLDKLYVILPVLSATDYDITVTAGTCIKEGNIRYTWKETAYGTFSFDVLGDFGDHTAVVDQAVEPTCAYTGLTEGSHCSVCNKVLIEQEVVPALGHSYNADVTAPTCTSVGYTTYTCSVCSDTYIGDEVSKRLHNDADYNGTCDVCLCDTNGDTQNSVMDYARTVESDILAQAAFWDIPAAQLQGVELLELVYVDASDKKLGTVELIDRDGDGVSDTLRFVPVSILSKIIRINCKVTVTATDGQVCQRLIPLCVVPATVMYYETDFAGDVFDITNDPNALGKPTSLLIDFDSNDITWKVNHATITDNGNGVLRGTVTGFDPNVNMSYGTGQIAYTVRKNDVIQIRILRQSGLGKNLSVFFSTTENPGYAGNNVSDRWHQFTDSPTGKYEVLTFTIASGAVGQTIDAFRIDPVDDSQKNGYTFEIDYIYVGCGENAPTPVSADGSGTTTGTDTDYLYFDFRNTQLDQQRYTSAIYDNRQYDINDSWTYRSKTLIAPDYNHAEGTLVLTTKAGLSSADVSDYHSHYIETKKLKYATGTVGTDVIYVRLKLENFDTSKKPEIKVHYYNYVGSTTTENSSIQKLNKGTDKENIKIDPVHLVNEDFFIMEIPATELQNYEKISRIRITVDKLYPASGEQGVITFDYVYIGKKDDFAAAQAKYDQVWQTINDDTDAANDEGKTEQSIVYGYDSAYDNDAKLSNGNSLFIKGAGIPNYDGDKKPIYVNGVQQTMTAFAFAGTGFDIISRTGANQGSVRVSVYDENGNHVKTVQSINKGESELYQIPVVSIRLEEYGTYQVLVFVAAGYDYGNDGNSDSFGGALDRGGEFYLDAVRIFNPINTSRTDDDSAYAYALYQAHGEGEPTFTEVRQMLIDSSKETSSDTMQGVAYLDTKDGSTTQIAAYTAGGPNNEVYLAPGNSIAFKLEAEGTIPASIDIGAKSADGTAVSMMAEIGSAAASTSTIATATALYYPLNIGTAQWQTANGKSYVTVRITNSGAAGILSITDIKYAYGVPAANTVGKPRSLRFLVDRDVLPPVEEDDVDGGISICETLSLESDLTMNFRIKTEQLAAYDLSTAYLVVERDVYNSNGTMEVETRTLTDCTIKDNRLVFAYTGISAAQMNDEIRAVLYIKDANGKEYKSNQKVTSVAIYSNLMLGASAGNEKLITLIMDMLNYGTAAQIYFNRHADAPVNEAFESFKTYADYASYDLKAALEDMSGTISNGNSSATVTQGLDLSTRVGITYKVKLPAGVDAANATLVIKDANGNELETFDLSTGTVDSKGRYCVTFFGSTSREMRRMVYATVTVDGEAISDTYTYTISSYSHLIANTAGMPDSLVNLTKLMVIYGDSADAYFA